jgi:hypothetical protein
MHRNFLFLFALLPLAACSVDEQQLCGKWQATAFYENGQSTKIPLDSIQLILYPDHRYHFKTLGFYSESGNWRASMNYIILTDTTSASINERMVKVTWQSADSLKIRMDRHGAEQALFLGRIQ